MSRRQHASPEHGFTLVEVMVAIVILLVGILGVVTMVDTSNAVTSKTKAREGGTNTARSIIEIARSVRYRDLTAGTLMAALEARPGLEDVKPSATGYTIRTRKVDYELTLTVCSLDDPNDRLGDLPEGVTFCPDTDVIGPGDLSGDRNPDDYKRVRVTLVWSTRNTSQSITQTSSIINPVGGLGPSVTGLTMTTPGSGEPLRIDSSVGSASFAAVTSTSAADLQWSVRGVGQGKADGGPVNWTFEWDFLDDDGDIVWHDCTYVIQADAFDAQGRSGATRAVTVVLNRRQPLAPNNLDGGRNGNADFVDLLWTANPECDIVGYRVFRSDTPGLLGTQVTCYGQGTATYVEDTRCVDDQAPAAGPLYYTVRAVDHLNASGTLREGDDSTQITVDGTNTVPSVPQNLTSCVGGQPDCLGPDGEPAPEGLLVIRWDASADVDGTVDFYRVYRDGMTYEHRHDVFFQQDGLIAWYEGAPDGQSHDYYVTAVDDDFGESDPSAPITAG